MILVAVDPDKHPEDPLRLGLRMARLAGAPIVPATVFPSSAPVPEDEVMRDLRDAAREDLLGLADELEGAPVADARVVASTSPARALQQLSEAPDVGMVVIGSSTRGPLLRVLPGSVADRLLSGSAVPVAVAPHGYGKAPDAPPQAIGVAYDGSEESQQALLAARELARRAGAALRIVTIHQRLAFGGIPASAMPGEPVNEVVERELRATFDAAVAEPSDVPVEGVFAAGRPSDVLIEQSETLDLLVAGSRGYGPLGAVLLGSTTHGLVRGAQCPVLITPRGRGLWLAG